MFAYKYIHACICMNKYMYGVTGSLHVSFGREKNPPLRKNKEQQQPCSKNKTKTCYCDLLLRGAGRDYTISNVCQ